MESFDLIILGGGSAGLYGALRAAELGARVLLVEAAALGGTCPNRGCLPTKHLVTVAERYYYGQSDTFFGVKLKKSRLDFASIMAEKALVTQFALEEKERMLSEQPKIRLARGRGRLVSSHEVAIDGAVFSADKIVLATGSSPIVPSIPGLESAEPLTSDTVQALGVLPERLIVVGGGEIGLEYGQLFLHLGVKVTLLEKEARLLSREEPEISAALRYYLEEEGMEIHTGVALQGVTTVRGERRLKVQRGDESFLLKAPALFVAAGRRPNTADLGLEKAGVSLRSDGAVEANEFFQTSVPHIFAAGDILGPERMLASVADRQGDVAVENCFRGTRNKIDYIGAPYAILTSPQVASVGLKEEEARRAGHSVRSATLNLRDELPKATADRGLVKLVVKEGTNQILGIHLLAAKAAEAIHEAIFIVKGKLTARDVCRTIHVYPSVAESILRTAEQYLKAA